MVEEVRRQVTARFETLLPDGSGDSYRYLDPAAAKALHTDPRVHGGVACGESGASVTHMAGNSALQFLRALSRCPGVYVF